MNCLWTLIALALLRPTASRGLKAPRALDEGDVLRKQLQVQNEALAKQNMHLKAMMQMARAEVHRMDAASMRAGGGRAHDEHNADAEVLKQEIADLKQKLVAEEADKTELVQTLRRMLAKNSTQIFQKQAEVAQRQSQRAQEMEADLELKFGKERQALEAQLQETNGKCADTNELAQSLQDDNSKLQTKMRALEAKLAKTMETNKELASDKVNLVTTMQSLMRENSKFKHGLQKETDLEQREAKELAADKAKLAALGKRTVPKPLTKQSRRLLMAFHHRNRTSESAQRAHMRAINMYIDGAEQDIDDDGDEVSEQQLSAMQRQEELFKKGKVGTHLNEWLGFKAAADAAKKVAAEAEAKKAVQKKKSVADDGGESEAEDLLVEAKSQLAAMNTADVESSDA